MTEREWLSSTEWLELWHALPAETLIERKIRLFSCAACRRIAHRIVDPRIAQALEVGERFADWNASADELAAADEETRLAIGLDFPPVMPAANWAAATASRWLCHRYPFKVGRAAEEAPSVDGYDAAIQAGLLNPDAPPDMDATARHACYRNGVVIPPNLGHIWQHDVFQRGEARARPPRHLRKPVPSGAH
jgi:hypothetical protein